MSEDEDEDEEWKINLVEGVEVVVPLGVFGGSVVSRRWMSYSPHSALPVAVDRGFQT